PSAPVVVTPDGVEAGAAVDAAGGVGFFDLQEDPVDPAGLGDAAEGAQDPAGETAAALFRRGAHAVNARPAPAEAHHAHPADLASLARRAVDGVGRAGECGDAVRGVGGFEALAEEDGAPGLVGLSEDVR